MSSFAVSNLKGVKVYNLTFGKTAEQWKEEQRAGHIRSLRYNEAFRRRVEFIQDASFTVGCLQIEMSPDGEWMLATGLYPPKLKMFDLSQLSMKFERGLETEPIDIKFLSPNWEKFVILRQERWMEFHSRHGKHYNLRMPLSGTCLCYNAPMCELYTGTVKSLVFRTNLEQGRYFAPFETNIDHINSCDIDSTHLLTAFGGNNSILECWDPRSKTCVSKLEMYDSVADISPVPSIEKIKFGNDGLTLAVGLSSGHTAVYDIRRYKPIYVLNQKNSQSINDICFHNQSNCIMTSDSKSIRYWSLGNGAQLYTIIQPSELINGMAAVGNSGVLFVAQEQHRIGAYYVPSVGCAPKWCPFLDSMTEELEESKYKSIYYNYKFVTRNELEALGLTHLIGTNLLKAYMHGFYIDMKLYRRVKSIVDPDAYEKFIKMKTKEQIDSNRSNRISIKKTVSTDLDNIKINKGYANYLIDKSRNMIVLPNSEYKHNTDENENDDDAKFALEPLIDPRFNVMFKSEEFEVTDDRMKTDLQFRPELLRNDDILNAMQYDVIKQYATYYKYDKKKDEMKENENDSQQMQSADKDDKDDQEDRFMDSDNENEDDVEYTKESENEATISDSKFEEMIREAEEHIDSNSDVSDDDYDTDLDQNQGAEPMRTL